MPVDRSCSDGDIAVVLSVSQGAYLVYEIVAGVADVEWSLVTENDTVITDKASCPSPCTRKWPDGPGEPGPDTDQQHVLSMQFVSEGSVDYKVTKHDASGAPVDTLKACRFRLTGAPDDFFEPLRILVR